MPSSRIEDGRANLAAAVGLGSTILRSRCSWQAPWSALSLLPAGAETKSHDRSELPVLVLVASQSTMIARLPVTIATTFSYSTGVNHESRAYRWNPCRVADFGLFTTSDWQRAGQRAAGDSHRLHSRQAQSRRRRHYGCFAKKWRRPNTTRPVSRQLTRTPSGPLV